jgi:heat-inducible transcriptional repressor
MAMLRAGLTTRQRRVLDVLCREYVLTGQPVSSLALARRHRLSWSSATIRSELAELERAGCLRQPHAASGRVPTAAGLQAWLEQLDGDGPVRLEHRRAVDVGVRGGDSAASVRGAARVLGELGGCVGIGFIGRSHAGVVAAVELAPLGDGHVLAVLDLADGERQVRRISCAAAGRPRELSRVREHLCALMLGRTLAEGRARLTEIVERHERALDVMVREAVRVGLEACGAAQLDPLVMQVVGQATLAGTIDARQDLAELLELLEDYQRLAELLCQLLPGDGDRARVHVGVPLRAGSRPSHAGVSLVGCRLAVVDVGDAQRPATGVLALLGPQAMDYEALIPLVEYAARAFAKRA